MWPILSDTVQQSTYRDVASDKHHDASRDRWLKVFRTQVNLAGSEWQRLQLLHDVLRTLELLALKCQH